MIKIRRLYIISLYEQELQEYLEDLSELTDVFIFNRCCKKRTIKIIKFLRHLVRKEFLRSPTDYKRIHIKGEGKAIFEWEEEPEKEAWLIFFSYIEDLIRDLKISDCKTSLDNRSMEEIRKEGKRNFYGRASRIQNFITDTEYDKMNF